MRKKKFDLLAMSLLCLGTSLCLLPALILSLTR